MEEFATELIRLAERAKRDPIDRASLSAALRRALQDIETPAPGPAASPIDPAMIKAFEGLASGLVIAADHAEYIAGKLRMLMMGAPPPRHREPSAASDATGRSPQA